MRPAGLCLDGRLTHVVVELRFELRAEPAARRRLGDAAVRPAGLRLDGRLTHAVVELRFELRAESAEDREGVLGLDLVDQLAAGLDLAVDPPG